MDFTEHNNSDAFSIAAYQAGSIDVAGESHTQAILVKQDRVEPLAFADCQEMDEAFLSRILQDSHQPELIIVGTGDKQQFIPPKLQVQIAKARIGLEMMSTPSACRTFNILLSENRKVWALLWPTTQD